MTTCKGRGNLPCDECGGTHCEMCALPMAEHSGEVSCCGPANGAMATLLRATQEALVEAVDGYSPTRPWGREHTDAITKAREAVG